MVLDEDDKPRVVQGIMLDIIPRKRAEEAMQESEAPFKNVLEIMPIDVWIADRDGTIFYGNLAGHQIWVGARYVGPDRFDEYKGSWRDTGERIKPEEWGVTTAVLKALMRTQVCIRAQVFQPMMLI